MDNYLEHYGVQGMHWGIRRYQNKDGSLTSAGKAHYKTGEPRKKKLTPEQKDKVMKAVKIGAAATVTALSVVGAYKLAKSGELTKAARVGKKLINNGMSKAKVEAADWNRIRKESVKKAYQGLKDGAPEAAYNSGKTISKVMVGGVTWMAGIEVADLMSNGAATQKILRAYNDHQKKDNKVKTSYRNNNRNDYDD